MEPTQQTAQLKQKIPPGFRKQLLAGLFRGLWRWLALGVAATAISTVTAYLVPLVITFTVDSVIGTKPMGLPGFLQPLADAFGGRAGLAEHLWLMGVAVVAVSLVNGAFSYLRGHAMAFFGEGFSCRLRNRLFRHLQAVPYAYYKNVQTGDLVQRCTSDVETVRRFVQMQLVQVVRTVCMAVTAFAIMLPISGKMTALSSCFFPLLIAASFVYFRRVQARFLKADQAEGELSTVIQENLTGMRVVRAFAAERTQLGIFTQKNETFRRTITHLNTLMGMFWGATDTLGYLQIALSLCCGVWFAANGELTLGQVMLFSTYTSMLTFPMRQLGRVLADLGKADVALTRLEDILCTPEEAEPGRALAPAIDGSIEFDDVCFDYGDGVPVLQHISFRVQPGQTVGILGSTGSGKSTLVQLIQRLYTATSGHVSLSGVDVNDIERHHLRRSVGLVLQEPFLYSRTIGENIAIARPGAAMDDITAAARTASVHDVIESFEHGYSTVVGERGVTLSGGQKQRVAIARTLLQAAPILIFDDSLSAVDAETDAAIRDALCARAGGTMLLISHRIATVRRADLILVMDGGRIVQMGTHKTLCREAGMYRRVCELQAELDEAVPQEGGR
ncbi:MAG: ABC transporter ATP-binding protein [Ruthenibacterium sp.]